MCRALWIALACSAAAAGCVCPPGTALCDGDCIDVANDADNCGACGNPCVLGCSEGRCDRECATAADCSDGLLCNGTELCTGDGLCLPGSAPFCDDGIGCTEDRCVEPAGTCEHVARDDLCAAGERCLAGGCAFCPGSPCDLVAQCGCASGETCGAAGDANVCEAAGSVPELEQCTPSPGGSDCAPGLTCGDASSDGSGYNLCSRYCAFDTDCPAPARCVIPIGRTDVSVCNPHCDPLDFTCAGAGQCYLLAFSFGWLTTCSAPAGTVPRGGRCPDVYDCQARLACVNVDAVPTCLPICILPGGSCPSGTGPCTPFRTPARIGSIEYGVCPL